MPSDFYGGIFDYDRSMAIDFVGKDR